MEMHVEDGYYESEIYSQAFSLPQLRSTGEAEIRVLGEEYVFGDMSATIVKNGRVKTCYTTIQQDNNQEFRIKRGSCKSNAVKFNIEAFKEMVRILADFNKREIYCTNVMDGWGGIIEGVYEGKRFSFKFMNPSACDTPETNEVSRILDLLEPEA